MSPDEPGRRGWRREGGPSIGEFVLALVLVFAIAVVGVILLGAQTSTILVHNSGTI